MRTKTLLLTAALSAAGIATSMAQVYSQNAVGYINLSLTPGFNLIANQLAQPPGGYTLNALIPNPPPGSSVYRFSGGVFATYTFDDADLIWTPNGTATLDLGKGFWIQVPSAYTLTFVGEVPQNTLTTPTPTGFNLVASQVPQSGPVSQPNGTSAPGDGTLGLNPGPGDLLYKYAGGVFATFTFDDADLIWTPRVPSISVGEAFWLLRAW